MENKHIKAKSFSQVYKGNVTITILRGKKPYRVIKEHNLGTVDFFEYICKCIMGYNMSNEVPTYIFPCGDSSGQDRLINFGVATDGLPTVVKDSVNDICALKYTFLIPGTIIQNKPIKSFQLCSLGGSNPSAQKTVYATLMVPGQGDQGGEITVTNINDNILIEWDLAISNGSTDIQTI